MTAGHGGDRSVARIVNRFPILLRDIRRSQDAPTQFLSAHIRVWTMELMEHTPIRQWCTSQRDRIVLSVP